MNIASSSLHPLASLSCDFESSFNVDIYDMLGGLQQKVIQVLTYLIPQLTLFDLSEKAVHAEAWEPLALSTLGALTAYGLFFVVLYLALGMLSFYRRPL